MARPKKVVDQETDYQLMKKIKAGDQKAKWDLFKRYELLMYKQYHAFRKICVDNKYTGIEVGTPESFMYDCWEPYQKALDTTELDKIDHCPVYDSKKKPGETMTQWRARRKIVGYEDHSDSWKFWITFWGYIKKQNEVQINHYINDCQNTTGIVSYSNAGEEFNSLDLNMPESMGNSVDASYFKKEESIAYGKVISNAYNRFNSVQKRIWNCRQDEMSRQEILKTLGITNKVFNENFEAMRDMVNYEIKRINVGREMDLTKI